MSKQSVKQYGLIDPKKNKPIARPSIFNSDSDSNNEDDKPTGITGLKKKERLAQEKAIAEDPTIYQYDELYDDIQNKRKESKLARKDLDRKPKYINKLLESAERRKRENERRIEREVQKEREAEGDMFKDKESFVTSAYRKKLEEMKELEEKEKREEYLETIGDVRKQGDLSGFYRHLYAQKVNYEEEDEKQQKLKELASKSTVTQEQETTISTEETVIKPKETQTKKRKYRKREASVSEQSDSESEKQKLQHLPSNLDADSDFSIDSDSSENSDAETNDAQNNSKKLKIENDLNKTEQANQIETTKEGKIEEKPTEKNQELEPKTDDKTNKETAEENQQPPEEVSIPKKPKIDIWKKRTVGAVFDDALKRFYERKSSKIQSV